MPIFDNIFGTIIYKNILYYLTANKLILEKQSGFKPGDSCVNQLLSITHEIYHSLDKGTEVRGAFLDISKTFDKVLALRPDSQIKSIRNFEKHSPVNVF